MSANPIGQGEFDLKIEPTTHADLKITSELLSLTGRMRVVDTQDAPLYVIARRSIFSMTYDVESHDGARVASIRRKILAWVPTWIVQGQAGEFVIRRRALSLTTKFDVRGGPYDGAVITGNWTGLRFNIRHSENLLAESKFKIFSLRQEQVIEVKRPEDVLLSVIALGVVSIDRKEGVEKSHERRAR